MLDLIALVAIFVSLPDVHVTFAPSAAFPQRFDVAQGHTWTTV
jgi:hypothetical protein